MDVKSTFLELPDLVVCPVRGVNASKLKADNLTEYLIDGIMKYFATDVGWLYISGNENEKDLNFTTAAQELSDWMISHKLNDFRDLAIYYGYEPSEFIHSLSLGFDSILNGSHPSWTDSNFKKIIGYANGVCFAYANHHQINWPGIASGYNLVLKLPRQNQFDNSLTDGWNIGFTKPFTTAPTSHVRILPNTIVDIEITRTEIQRFPSYSWPKSGILCKDSKSYSSSDSCANQAYGEAVKSVCGCLYINTPTDPTVNLTNVRFCSTFERGLCGLLNENLISDETIKRQQECLPVCTETIFTAHPSYGAINKSKIIKKYGLNENSVSL